MMDFERWKILMQTFNIGTNTNTYKSLVNAYSERHRHYHTVEHIAATLKHLDQVINLTEKAEEIELALWFHDAVYQPFSAKNELNSACWVAKFLSQNGMPKIIIARVYQLIMVTQHTVTSNNQDESLIADIDLTVLGASEDVYCRFEQAIRKEYKLIPDFVYNKKRKLILDSFLRRERIFQNRYFHKKLEDQARLNLFHGISVL